MRGEFDKVRVELETRLRETEEHHRTEHFVRHVLSRLHTDARSPYGASWGDDLHELETQVVKALEKGAPTARSFCITFSTLKLAGSCRGGNSTSVWSIRAT